MILQSDFFLNFWCEIESLTCNVWECNWTRPF